jgi:TonB family protein
VNCLNEGGQTALILAAVMGHAEIVAHLIAAGADPQVRDHLNLTALEWSTRRGFSDVTKLLTKISPPLAPATSERTTTSVKPDTDKKASGSITGESEPEKPDPVTTALATMAETSAEPQAHIEFGDTSTAEVAQPANLASDSGVSPAIASPSAPAPPTNETEALVTPTETETAPGPATEPTVQLSDPVVAAVAPPEELQPPDTDPAVAIVSVAEPLPINEEDETLPQPGVPVSTIDITQPKAAPIAAPPEPEPRSAPSAQTPTLNKRTAAFSGSLLGLSASATGDDEAHVSNKRCPKCDTVYEKTPLLYCTRDYTALIDNDSFPSITAPELTAAPDPIAAHATSTTPIVVWLLIAFVLGASAFAAYRVTQYLFRTEPPSPIVAQSEAPPVEEKPFFTVAGSLAGMELNVPKPEYPAEIQDAGVAGPITVNIRVNKNGRVISAVSKSGDQRLRAAAVKAAKQATFAPDKLAEIRPRGRAVTGSITYEFAVPQTNGATPATTATAESSPLPSAATAPSSDTDAPVVGNELVSAAKNVPAADYPSRARRAGIGGTITVTIRVNRNGKVTSWRSSPGDSQLRAAAIKAARNATFSPDKLPGSGDVLGTITYNFTP